MDNSSRFFRALCPLAPTCLWLYCPQPSRCHRYLFLKNQISVLCCYIVHSALTTVVVKILWDHPEPLQQEAECSSSSSSLTWSALRRMEGLTVLPMKIWSLVPMFMAMLGIEDWAKGAAHADMVSFDTIFPSTSISTGWTTPSFKITKFFFLLTNTNLEPQGWVYDLVGKSHDPKQRDYGYHRVVRSSCWEGEWVVVVTSRSILVAH